MALFEENLEQLEEVVRDAPPEEAYVALLRATVEQLQRDRGFIELSDRGVPPEFQEELAERFVALAAKPLRRAQRAGRVRRDLKPDDTLLLVAMVSGAASASGKKPPQARIDQAFAIVLGHLAA